MTRYYRVAEFASLAGVTVRTLQYYDREGLLKPATNAENGYRLYRLDDLLRLQQILTLKWMGFALQEIRSILADPAYDLGKSLTRQKIAVDAQILQLQEASRALGQMIDLVKRADSGSIDLDSLNTIIRAVTGGSREQWPGRYYSDVAWAGIQARRLTYSQSDLKEVQEKWQALFQAFEQHRHESPASPIAQELAAQMYALLEHFTGGNPEIEAGLAKFAEDSATDSLPPEQRAYTPYGNMDEELRQFIQRAFTIYQQKMQRNSKP